MSVNVNNEKKAYAKFLEAGANVYGACGLIGNLEAESDGFYPDRVEYLCIQRLRENGIKDKNGNYYTQETYASAVDSGEISCESFLHPLPGKQYGFGLAQWTSPGRKSALYTLAKQKGVSIADLDMQIEFVLKEMKESYATVWNALKTVKSIREASDIVLKKFEVPADTSEAVCKRRAARGQLFYDTYVKAPQADVNKRSAEDYLDVWRMWIDYSEANGKFREIIDLYNSHKPLARGYAVKYSDEWCDTTVSAAAIKADVVDLIGTECGVEEHIKILKKKGIWNEDGTITPKPGDIIVYSWRTSVQPNNAYSDHIGVVESVQNGTITAIEGNKNEAVGRRVIPVGWGYIRGYACPKYESASSSGSTGATTTDTNLSRGSKGSEVKTMQAMLVAVGYSCGGYGADGDFGNDTDSALRKFQVANGLVADGIYGPLSKAKLEEVYKSYKDSGSSGGLNETPEWTGKVTADVLNVRVYAGTKYPNIKSIPTIKYGTSVEVCDDVKDEDGDIWYFVKIDGRIFGFVHSAYIKKN